MNTCSSRSPSPRAARWPLLVCLALIPLVSTGCFRLGSDTRSLRDSLATAGVGPWDETIEVGVGTLTLGLVRSGLSFVDLEPEARAAVSALRGAEVGVYQLAPRHRRLDRNGVLTAADEAMTERGWERLVGVMKGSELVAVYLPRTMTSLRQTRVCVLVIAEQQLVIASARGNPEPLLEMALREAPETPSPHEPFRIPLAGLAKF